MLQFSNLEHFSRDISANKNDSKDAKAKFARQDDDESTLLMVITEAENISRGSFNRLCYAGNHLQEVGERSCNKLQTHNKWLPPFENVKVSMKEDAECNDQWYLDSGCSKHMMRRKY